MSGMVDPSTASPPPPGPAPAINLPSAGVLLYVVVTAYRRRRPEAQPVLVTAQDAPLAEQSRNLRAEVSAGHKY